MLDQDLHVYIEGYYMMERLENGYFPWIGQQIAVLKSLKKKGENELSNDEEEAFEKRLWEELSKLESGLGLMWMFPQRTIVWHGCGLYSA